MRTMTKQTNSYPSSFSFPDLQLSSLLGFLGSCWGLSIELILKYDRRHHSMVSTKDGSITSNNVIDNTAAPNKNKKIVHNESRFPGKAKQMQPRSQGFFSKKMGRAGKGHGISGSILLSDWLIEM